MDGKTRGKRHLRRYDNGIYLRIQYRILSILTYYYQLTFTETLTLFSLAERTFKFRAPMSSPHFPNLCQHTCLVYHQHHRVG